MSIALDPAGGAYIAGYTSAPDFPVTPGADMTIGGTVFAAKLNPDGSSDSITRLSSGEGLISQRSRWIERGTLSSPVTVWRDFPTTAGAYDTTFNGGFDAFVSSSTRPGRLALLDLTSAAL